MNEDNDNKNFNVGWQPKDTDSERIRGIREARASRFKGIVSLILAVILYIDGIVEKPGTGNAKFSPVLGSILLLVGIGFFVYAKFLENKFKD